ncbi:Phospho-N-acetylmuramoyl-pentapeptide-transferas e [Chlamydiales bacterium STE3]|nr:Phospho-N-acetylmuramoyl-pentapeptide-transferas e [Chlamydiales bacterium STE3]
MIFLLMEWLKENYGIKVPSVFGYFSTRMILASLTSLVLCIFLGPFFIRKLCSLKIGQTIRKEECPTLGKLHGKKQDTPTMGGLLILFSMIASMTLWMNLKSAFTLILFITTLWLGALGARDDYLKLRYKNAKGLSAKKKMFYQALISAFVAAYMLVPGASDVLKMGSFFVPPTVKTSLQRQNDLHDKKPHKNALSLKTFASSIYVPFVKEPILVFKGFGLLFAFLFMMFIIVGSSNAVNLTDGLDGLATGCLILVAGTFSIFAFVSNNFDLAHYLNIPYIEGSGEIAIYLSAFAGACLGFLWYNSHPAQVFMGDTGSLALGGIIGVSAVLLKREILLGLVGGVFVAETLSVIVQVASYRLRDRKRVFLCAPLHHHFEFKGWKETKVVVRFWIVGLILAILGIASLKFQ